MPDRPNLLLITADQMRWDCLGCGGNPVIRTPTLDALAGRGVRFTNAFSPNPICVPTRASIMTGNYPQTCTGIKGNHGRIRDGQPLLTEMLRDVGYRAYAEGKLHFVPYAPPGEPRLVHGFEHVDLTESGRILAQFDPQHRLRGLEDYPDYLDDVGWGGFTRAHGIGNNDVRPCASPLPAEHHVDHWIADCTIRRIDAHLDDNGDRPFFLWMSSPKPHSPYDPPRPWDQLYDPRSIPEPFGDPSLLPGRYPELDKTRYAHAVTSLSPEAWKVSRAYYYGSISFLDAMIGRVLEHLDERGLADDTIIVFAADHGDLIGDFGSCFKANHLNGSVRVPFLAAGPGIARGVVSDALVSSLDLLPTFAAWAGREPPAPVDGRSIAPLLGADVAGAGNGVREFFFSSTEGACGQSAMVTDGRWKFIYSEANGCEELYDQRDDIAETRNLAADPACAGVVERMRAALRACAVEFADDRLLDGDGFARREVDTSAFASEHATSMGWRWY